MHSLEFFFNLNLFLGVLGLRCYVQTLSSCTEQRLVAVHMLLTAVASLVAEQSFYSMGTVVVVECGIFPDQGANEPVSPALGDGFLSTVPPVKSWVGQ